MSGPEGGQWVVRRWRGKVRRQSRDAARKHAYRR